MRILLLVNHPGHVHHFRNFIKLMEARGHEFLVLASDKEVTLSLLEHFGISFRCYGSHRRNMLKKAGGLLLDSLTSTRWMFSFRPDILVGRGSPILALLSFVWRKPFLLFSDTEHVRPNRFFTYPFASRIITPAAFRGDLGPRHVRVDSYFELAYLHPDYFQPFPNVRPLIGVADSQQFSVLRFVSWAAHHDVGVARINVEDKRQLVDQLLERGPVFISSEAQLPSELEQYRCRFPPELLHSVLAAADLYIGEGATTATEAAILGTPAILLNPLAQKCGVHRELADYGMLHVVNDTKSTFSALERIWSLPNAKDEWRRRREELLQDKVSMTEWMLNYVDAGHDSFEPQV